MDILKSLLTILLFILFYFVYTYFVYTQKSVSKDANKTISPLAHKGKKVFQKYNCISCHQLYGLGGYLGPDLTNVISAKEPHYVRSIIKNPAKLLGETTKMPNLNVTDDEIDHLVEFLYSADSSGIFPLKEFGTTWYGTIIPKTEKK